MSNKMLPVLALSLTVMACQPNAQETVALADPAPAPVEAPAPAPVAPATPVSTDPAPAVPAWAAAMIGKPVAELFPTAIDGCIGSADVIGRRYTAPRSASRIDGWAWNVTGKAPFEHLVVADTAGVIVGAGMTQTERPDVLAARTDIVTDLVSGYQVVTPGDQGVVSIYGIDEAKKAACKIADRTL